MSRLLRITPGIKHIGIEDGQEMLKLPPNGFSYTTEDVLSNILVLTCSFNEQKYSGTFHFEVGREVDLTGMYVKCVLSVI